MFTGLVERSAPSLGRHVGEVRVTITTVLGDVEMGASIAVNGCC